MQLRLCFPRDKLLPVRLLWLSSCVSQAGMSIIFCHGQAERLRWVGLLFVVVASSPLTSSICLRSSSLSRRRPLFAENRPHAWHLCSQIRKGTPFDTHPRKPAGLGKTDVKETVHHTRYQETAVIEAHELAS